MDQILEVGSARVRRWRDSSALTAARGELKPSLKALALVVVLATAIAVAHQLSAGALGHARVSLLFLLPVVIAVVRWGVVPAAIAAIASRAVLAYWYYPPVLSLHALLQLDISDFRFFINIVTLAILLAAILVHQARAAARRETEMRQLYEFSRQLVRAHSSSEIFHAIQSHLASILSRRVILLWRSANAQEEDNRAASLRGRAAAEAIQGPQAKSWIASSPSAPRDDGKEIHPGRVGQRAGPGLACIPTESQVPACVRTLAEDILSQKAGAAGQTCEGDFAVRWLVRPVSAKTAVFGAIAVEIGSEETKASVDKISGRIAGTLSDAVKALEALEIDRAIRDAGARAEADRLREAMIGAVSHDLGTPLARILCSATVLGTVPSVTEDERARGLVNAIREEAERHGKDIENLLDASRITGNAVRLHRQWTDLNDVVNAAVERLQRRRGARTIETRLPHELPLVHVDSLVLERALVQILDNAAKYSAADAPISLAAGVDTECIRLTVSDLGSGLTEAEKTSMWQRSSRGERHAAATRGSGLGLWIAQAFVAANGGSVEADSAGPGCGTTISIVLPLANVAAGGAPELEEEHA